MSWPKKKTVTRKAREQAPEPLLPSEEQEQASRKAKADWAEAERLREAQRALESFWGVSKSRGGTEDYRACRTTLEAMNLTPAELRLLRLRLPTTTGTVADRIATLEHLLLELEG